MTPDAILLFRLGDFYEMFEEDARVVSRQLDLVLTSRRFSNGIHVARLAGLPDHVVERAREVMARLEAARGQKAGSRRQEARDEGASGDESAIPGRTSAGTAAGAC